MNTYRVSLRHIKSYTTHPEIKIQTLTIQAENMESADLKAHDIMGSAWIICYTVKES